MSDLVTFGETMLRLSPPGHERLESTNELEIRAAGAESNAAVAAQRLGMDATWLSKVPDTPLGRRVVNDLEGYGIDTSVAWSETGRQGTYYLEHGGKPRGTNVIYDRDRTAVATAAVPELDVRAIENASVFFTSGITPALSQTLTETTVTLLKGAVQHDTRTVFDFNYRAKLWEPAAARETLTGLFPGVDVLIIAERDAREILDLDGKPGQLAHQLGTAHGFDTVVLTRGAQGVTAWHDSVIHDQVAFETETHDPIGTGDAFSGAFIARRHQGDDIQTALEYAAATAALKRTIPGDVALVDPDEVDAVVTGGSSDISR